MVVGLLIYYDTTPMPHPLYHYCPTTHLPRVLDDGFLRPSAEGAAGSRETPALWFTSQPTYEPTAIKLWEVGGVIRQMTLDEQARRCGLARIVVPPDLAPLTWAEWARTSGVRPEEVKRMARIAKRLGSDVRLYRATFDAVPVDRCLRVESSQDGRTWSLLAALSMAA